MSFKCLVGSSLELVENMKKVTIDYKHGSVLGIGGDKTQSYNVTKYRCSGLNNSEVKMWVYLDCGLCSRWDLSQLEEDH